LTVNANAQLHRILFVCTGNTCRSVLAEYLGRRFYGQAFAFESAGIRPQGADHAQNAIATLRSTFRIDASAHKPRNVRALDLGGFDLVIAFERNVAVVVRGLGVHEAKLRVWNVQDPWGGNLAEYDTAALEIRQHLAALNRVPRPET
jgi:protein arginine phosphatase